jgi:hypothetical protein
VIGPRLVPVCLTRDQANEFIVANHRHHGRVTGHRFIVGALSNGQLVGVAVAGRPRARRIEQYQNVEVSRLCASECPNVCSFLYGKCSRVARELGFWTCFTAILERESGGSLKASGWVPCYLTRGGTQDRPSRRRVDKSSIEPKQIWAPSWCADRVKSIGGAK